MTITPGNQPHTPRLQIDLDEIVSTIIIELAASTGLPAMPGIRSQPDR